MKSRGIAAFLALLLASCGWVTHPVDYSARSYGELDKKPLVLVSLLQAQQICTEGKSNYAAVDIRVILRNLPEQKVKLRINGDDRYVTTLYGTLVILSLTRMGLGAHYVEVWVEGYSAEPVTLGWTVYHCAPLDRGKLYRSDGKGLKGYCPEPEPCECPKEQEK